MLFYGSSFDSQVPEMRDGRRQSRMPESRRSR
jgi:hypothetical protein